MSDFNEETKKDELNEEVEKSFHEINEVLSNNDDQEVLSNNDDQESTIVDENSDEIVILDEQDKENIDFCENNDIHKEHTDEQDDNVILDEEDEIKSDETVVNDSIKKANNEGKENKSSPIKKILLVTLCFILAFAGGLTGTILGNYLSRNDKTILYQSVEHEINNTSSDVQTLNVKEIAKIASVSVVEIQTETVSTSTFFQQAISSGAGSGVILSSDGYVVSNHHVIEGANKIRVTTSDGTSYDAILIGSDAATDLAVLKIEATNLKAATLGTSSTLEVGDNAVAIGNPLGELGGTVTDGIISALDREITIDNQTMHLLQTNAAINPGNSGGGLFDNQGHLIGIVNAKSSGSDIEGLGFAIPIDKAKPVIESIIEHGYVKGRPSLGIMLQSSAAYDSSKANIYIARINPNEACDRAGLKVGDQILEFGGETIDSVTKFKDVLNLYQANDKVEMKVLRNNEIITVTITLDDAQQSINNQPTNQDTQTNPTQNYGNNYDDYFGNDDEFDIFDFFR